MKTTIRTIAALLLAQVAALAFAQSLGWRLVPGAANDIGVGPRGEVWVIGNDRSGNDYGIYRLDGNNWTKIPGGAVRIAVGPSGPWVVNSSGGIYRWNGSGWDQVPGGAKDIGIGANGTVWVIGGNVEVGGFGIYRWNGSGWDKIPGSAVRIDVDPQGNAWVVTSGHAIYRYNGSAFVQLPGAALDIGIGANGAVFVVGTDGGVYNWDGSNWVHRDGNLANISVDHQGQPWGVNAGKQVWAATVPTAGTVPPPGAPPRKGVTVKNESKSYAWMTIYVEAGFGIRNIKGSGCIAPGQENSWPDIDLKSGTMFNEYVITRVERTSTENCASLPGNRHVTCDTSKSWTRAKAGDIAPPYVLFTVRDASSGACTI